MRQYAHHPELVYGQECIQVKLVFTGMINRIIDGAVIL